MKNKVNTVVILFAAFYVVLPSYFALEISELFPLITASRIMILMLLITYIWKSKGLISITISNIKFVNKHIIIFFMLLMFVNLIHFNDKESLNEIFSLVFDSLLVIWLISKLVTKQNQIIRFLEIMAYFSGVVACISIIGTLFDINLFFKLNLVSRNLILSDFTRMGILRPQAGFDHAVHYGLYCTIMVIISYYLMEESSKVKSFKFAICIILNIISLLLANSRGSMITLAIVFFIRIISIKKINRQAIRRSITFLLISVLGLALLMLVNNNILSYISNIFISIFSSLFNTSNIVSIQGYGTNVNGLLSRTSQFSGIQWVYERNPFFGMGAGALNNKLVKFIRPETGLFYVTDTYDVGYIQIFCNFGIMGSLAYFSLYSLIVRILIYKKNDNKNWLHGLFKSVFLAFFVGYLSVDINGTSKLFWTILALLIAYANLEKKFD